MSLPEEVHRAEFIEALKRKVLKGGVESLSAQERFDFNKLVMLGKIDSKKLELEYRDNLAEEAYTKLLSTGVLDEPALDYGIKRGFYSFEEVEATQEAYHLRIAKKGVLEYGSSGIPNGERLHLEHCLESGLISPEEIAELDVSREDFANIIDVDFRKNWF